MRVSAGTFRLVEPINGLLAVKESFVLYATMYTFNMCVCVCVVCEIAKGEKVCGWLVGWLVGWMYGGG